MGMLFNNILNIFRKKRPNKAFHKAYEELKILSKMLKSDFVVLRRLQKQYIRQLKKKGVKFAGHSNLSKTLVIEEELLPKLKKINNMTRVRFNSAKKDSCSTVPISAAEDLELNRITKLLHEVDQLLIREEEIKKKEKTIEKLHLIEESLKAISKILKEFHFIEMYGLEKNILTHKISPLLNKIFYSPDIHTFFNPNTKKKETLYEYSITPNQLKKLQKEAHKINSYNDPKYKIDWRYWWREEQKTEIDRDTGYHKEHINFELKLDGEKKNIHLLLKTA